jgi:hypothetical protein
MEEYATHPRIWAKDLEGTEAELEAKAVAQFDEERREHIPGLALSDIPCRFFVRCKPGGSQTVSLSKYWREPSKWQYAHAELLDSFHYLEPMEPLVPKRWSYAKLLGNAKPERFDLANPRVYSLTGKQMPWLSTPGQVGSMLTATFERTLADLYRKAPANGKRAEVGAFLDHHHTNGGNAQALTDHLERMLERWKESPPQYSDLHKLQRVTVEGIGQLTALVEAWLANAPKAPTSAPQNTLPPPIRPRTLAERLDAKPGARDAFDTMLRIDGYMNDARQCTLKGRKGKSGILAAWDAVVERFGIDGYSNGVKSDEALSSALMEYMPPLEIQKRVSKLRDSDTYSEALKSCMEYLKERESRNVRERSDTAE